jgi:hypothetical protein
MTHLVTLYEPFKFQNIKYHGLLFRNPMGKQESSHLVLSEYPRCFLGGVYGFLGYFQMSSKKLHQ